MTIVLHEIKDGKEHENKDSKFPHLLVDTDGNEHKIHPHVRVVIDGKVAWLSGLAQGMNLELTGDPVENISATSV